MAHARGFFGAGHDWIRTFPGFVGERLDAIAMRRLAYRVLHPVGGGSTRRTGTVVDLLQAIPYLLDRSTAPVPSLRVLNDVLRRGRYDAGMSGGCIWRPFRISRREYPAVRDELRRRLPGLGVAKIPPWVRSWEDWHCFVLHHTHGVPVVRYRALARDHERLKRAAQRALARDDAKAHAVLWPRALSAGRKLASLVERYVVARRSP